MRRQYTALVGIALVAQLVSGCGTSDRTEVSSSPTSAPASKNTGENRRDTALGRMCRYFDEVSTAMADVAASTAVVEGKEPTKASDSAARMRHLKTVMTSAQDELGSDEGLPRDAAAFRQSLLDAAAAAAAHLSNVADDADGESRKEAYEAVSNDFAFLAHDDSRAKGFESAVKNDTSRSCPTLGRGEQDR